MRCSVRNCKNDTRRTTKTLGITFHKFPKDPSLRTAWIEALGLSQWEPKDRSAVCSEHFEDTDIFVTRSGLRKIKNGAVPTPVLDLTEDLDAPAALRVCRICLTKDAKMYHFKAYKLDTFYEQVLGVNMSEDDKLPRMLCWECSHRLVSAHEFRSKALRCHALLRGLINPVNYITLRDIESIDRSHHRLKSTLVFKHIDTRDFFHVEDTNVVVKQEISGEGENEEAVEYLEEEDKINIAENRSEENVKEEVVSNDIQDETANQIYFEEYVDFDDSDDMALSEVYADVSKKNDPKKKKKIKEKKEKGKRESKKRDMDESPTSTMDKFKTSDVKRRRTNEGIDESLFTVTQLTYEQQMEEVARRQHLASYTGAPYRCDACYRGFLRKDRFDAHSVRHSEQSGAYECFICRTRLKTARALRKHLTAQHTLQYSCKGCAFVTRNKGVARDHEKWHAGTKYQCPHCPSEFDKVTTYLGHVRIKHVSDFVCELCGFTFVSKKGIDVHKKKKHRMVDKLTIDGPYCATCDVRFISEEAYDRHLKLSSKHSSDDDPNRIRNDSQNATYRSGNGGLMRRVERRPVIHPRAPGDTRVGPGGPVTCEQCGVQLRDLRLYAQHFRRAHPDKNRTKYPAMKTPCMCEQCGRIFQSMALLKDHMWVHTGVKRFKCERCDKSFTQRTNLMFHMRTHSATRPTYECPLCGKHFAFFNNRRRHMFIHTGLKPHKCDTCGKSFTTGGELRAHVDHVHMKKPWPKRARPRPADWHRCERED